MLFIRGITKGARSPGLSAIADVNSHFVRVGNSVSSVWAISHIYVDVFFLNDYITLNR